MWLDNHSLEASVSLLRYTRSNICHITSLLHFHEAPQDYSGMADPRSPLYEILIVTALPLITGHDAKSKPFIFSHTAGGGRILK